MTVSERTYKNRWLYSHIDGNFSQFVLKHACRQLEDCTLPHMFCWKLPESSGFHWNLPESNPRCDKSQIGIFILGGVQWSPLETSIFRRSPWNPSRRLDFFCWGSPLDSGGIQWNNQTPAESNRITRLWRNPAESSGLQWTPAELIYSILI